MNSRTGTFSRSVFAAGATRDAYSTIAGPVEDALGRRTNSHSSIREAEMLITARRSRELFKAEREPIDDDAWVEALGASPEEAPWCVVVRKTIAHGAKIPPEYVLPDEDPNKIFALLPWYCDGWEPVHFVMSLESILGEDGIHREIEDDVAEKMPSPFIDFRLSKPKPHEISEWMKAFIGWKKERIESTTGSWAIDVTRWLMEWRAELGQRFDAQPKARRRNKGRAKTPIFAIFMGAFFILSAALTSLITDVSPVKRGLLALALLGCGGLLVLGGYSLSQVPKRSDEKTDRIAAIFHGERNADFQSVEGRHDEEKMLFILGEWGGAFYGIPADGGAMLKARDMLEKMLGRELLAADAKGYRVLITKDMIFLNNPRLFVSRVKPEKAPEIYDCMFRARKEVMG